MNGLKLTPETYQKLLDAERGLTAVVGEFEKAEKCGIDCQDKREKLRNQLAMIAQLKANYNPASG